VDHDLAIGENVALALATSAHLQTGNLAAFHAQAKSLLKPGFPGFTFVLSDPAGQQRVNVLRPFGAPLPLHGNLSQLKQVFGTGRTVISDVYIGGVLGVPLVGIDVPVWLDGRIAFDLSVGFLPGRLGQILKDQALRPERLVSIFDSRGVYVARTLAPEQYVGTPGPPLLVQQMLRSYSGVVRTRSNSGIPTIFVFNRSFRTGWSVAIGIPVAVVRSEVLGSVAFVMLLVGIILATGFGAAWILGGRIGRSVRNLVPATLALGAGERMALPESHFHEAIEVASALQKVEGELEAHRHHLESLVAERTEALRASTAQLESRSEDLKRINGELAEAVGNVRTLAGLLPICSYCKKIRDDKGYWDQIESYVSQHSEAKFSHGICPDCARKHFPEFRIPKRSSVT
jgi:hypothetical protein